MHDLLLEVRTAAGVISAETDKIISAEVERVIDDIGRLRVTVPVSEPLLAQATISRRLHLFYRGTVIAVGLINERPPEVVSGGPATVTLDTFLLFASLLLDNTEDSRWPAATALSTILGAGAGAPPGLLNGTGWTLSIEVGPGAVTAQHDFAGEDLVAAVRKVVDEAEDGLTHPLHWWADSTNTTLYVGILGADSGLRLAQAQGNDPVVNQTLVVESIEDRSTGEVVNSIEAWGGSAGCDRLPLPHPKIGGAYDVSTRASRMGGLICYVEDAASVAAYGLRRSIWHNNAANTRNMTTPQAQDALYYGSCARLLRSKDEHRAWVVKAHGSALAALNPGHMVDLWYRGAFSATTLTGTTVARTRSYDGAAYITKIVRRFDRSGERYTLECGWSLDHKVGSSPADSIGRAIATAVQAAGAPAVTRMATSGAVPVGSAAPSTCGFLTMAAEATLSSERILTAGTGLTLTDAGAGLAATLALEGASTYCRRMVVSKAGIADNAATPIFTVTTVNEAGDTDGGTYICHVRAACSHASAAASTCTAIRFYEGRWARAIEDDGAGGNSAVTEIADDCAVASGVTRAIDGIVGTVAETSEYVQTFSLAIDLSGAGATTAEVVAEVNVLWYGFTTPPVIAAA